MKARALEGCWVSHAPIGYINVKDVLKRPTLGYADDDTAGDNGLLGFAGTLGIDDLERESVLLEDPGALADL